jgi:hypothetical protein
VTRDKGSIDDIIALEVLVPQDVSADVLGRFVEGVGLAYRRAMRLAEDGELLSAAEDGSQVIRSLLDVRELSAGWLIRPRQNADRLRLATMTTDRYTGLLTIRFSSRALSRAEKPITVANVFLVLLGAYFSSAAEVRDLVEVGMGNVGDQRVMEYEGGIDVDHARPGGRFRDDPRVPPSRRVECEYKELTPTRSGSLVRVLIPRPHAPGGEPHR